MTRHHMDDDAVKCSETMQSNDISGHIHTCVGRHPSDEDHFCGHCQRWWGKAN